MGYPVVAFCCVEGKDNRRISTESGCVKQQSPAETDLPGSHIFLSSCIICHQELVFFGDVEEAGSKH